MRARIEITENKKILIVKKIENTTFKEWQLTESDLQSFIAENLDSIFDDDEHSYLLVGRENPDENGKRSDLIALDDDGNLVLLELKRDKTDAKSRAEPLEFQAIRYVASLALIKTPEQLITH